MSPEELKLAIDTVWVIVAGCMVFLMQAGFAMLEVGFSRGKNVGAVVAKILVNLSIGTIAFWAVGFALAFGNGNKVLGTDGFFLHSSTFSSLSFSDVPLSAKFLFEVVFCTVSLAIVWGTMLDRTKFGVYIIFAIVFAALIYPLVGHWIWGGGFLAQRGMQDFAGSTVVHLCGATRGARRHAHARRAHRQVRLEGQAASDPGPLDAAGGARRADPVVRLVRLQPGLDARRRRRALRRHRRDDEPRRVRRRARRDHRRVRPPAHDRHRLRRQRRDRRPGRHHGALRLRRGLGRMRDRPGRRRPHGADRRRDRPHPRRRSDRRDRRARHGRHLGHALVRALHARPRWPSSNGVGERRPVLRRRPAPARRPGVRHRRRGRVRVRLQPGRVLPLQEDDRPARERAAGARGPRHPRARHVGLSRAVPARLRRDPALRAGSQPPPAGARAVARSRRSGPSTTEGGD